MGTLAVQVELKVDSRSRMMTRIGLLPSAKSEPVNWEVSTQNLAAALRKPLLLDIAAFHGARPWRLSRGVCQCLQGFLAVGVSFKCERAVSQQGFAVQASRIWGSSGLIV